MSDLTKEGLGLVSVVICFIGLGFYSLSILKGRTKPHILTWVAWTITVGVAFCAQQNKDAGAGDWATGVTALFCLTIAILAFFYGEKKITKTDWIAFLLALSSIPIWYFTHNPLHAVIMIVIADGFGFYPTFRKSFFKPHEENAPMFALDALKYILSLIATQTYTLTSLIYPAFVIFSNSTFLMMLFFRRRQDVLS